MRFFILPALRCVLVRAAVFFYFTRLELCFVMTVVFFCVTRRDYDVPAVRFVVCDRRSLDVVARLALCFFFSDRRGVFCFTRRDFVLLVRDIVFTRRAFVFVPVVLAC